MTQTMSGYIEQSDGRLYYEEAGEGEPLILGHAGFVDSGMWDAQWDAFTQRYRAIRYDMRGFGKSDPAQGPRNRRQDLAELLHRLDVERCALLGCSMSGTIMLDFALEHPEMVTTLMTASSAPSGYQPAGDPPPELLEMVAAAQQGDTALASELQLRIWVDGPYRQPEQVDTVVRQRAAVMNLISVRLNTFAIADLEPLNPLAPPAIDRLATITVPTLVMAGALDYPTTVHATDLMADAIPGAQKRAFAHSAHLPNMEEPEAFTQAVLDFLNRAQ